MSKTHKQKGYVFLTHPVVFRSMGKYNAIFSTINKNAKPSVSAIAYCLEGFIKDFWDFWDFRDYWDIVFFGYFGIF